LSTGVRKLPLTRGANRCETKWENALPQHSLSNDAGGASAVVIACSGTDKQ
jgi:hypothetical protein